MTIEPWGFGTVCGKGWNSRLWYGICKGKVKYSNDTHLDLLW